MLKTVRAFLALMQNQKKEIVFSVVLSFIDGFFIMIPFIIAFKIVNAVPLFNPAASGTLDVCTMYRYIGIMAVAVFIRIVLRYFTLYFRGGAGYKAMCRERKNLGTRLRKVSLGFLNEKTRATWFRPLLPMRRFWKLKAWSLSKKSPWVFLFLLSDLLSCLSSITASFCSPLFCLFRYGTCTENYLHCKTS